MKYIKELHVILVIVVLSVFGCRPDEAEFARPDSLAGPIYQQLESMETFTYYLKCLDKTDYAESLKTGGSWTVFAFDDAAFEAFMVEKGYSSFDDMPEDLLLHLIQYSIIVDAYSTTTLTYYKNQWYEGTSFRRHTQYSDSLITMSTTDYPHPDNEPNQTYLVDESRGRVKTTNYFLDSYFNYSAHALEYEDYSFMFSGENYIPGGMKVFESDVVNIGVVAENGLIYHLDKVLEPKDNLYQYISKKEEYSIFKSIIDRFGVFKESYVSEETGETVYTLDFYDGVASNYLAFDLNDENMPKLLNNVDRTFADATGLTVPTNEALTNYLVSGNSILGDYYDSYDDMPLEVLGLFINMNFFTLFYRLCPSNYGEIFTSGLNSVNYAESDVVETNFCSNGFLVGINKIYESTSFSTVLGPLLLDDNYSVMLTAVKSLGIDKALEGLGMEYSILGLTNDKFVNIPDPNSAGRIISVVDYDVDTGIIYMEVTGDSDASENRIYPDPTAAEPSSADVAYVLTTISSIVENMIVEEGFDQGSNNYYQTMAGEYVHSANAVTLNGGGNLSAGSPVTVNHSRSADNGTFYELDGPILRPENYTWGTLLQNSEYSKFLEVLVGANAKVAISGVSDDFLISFVNTAKNYTLFVPTNSAIEKAVTDGIIPDPTASSLNDLSTLERAQARVDLLAFAKAHFVLVSIATDGKTDGTFTSPYYSDIINLAPVYVDYEVENTGSSLIVKNATTGAVEAQTTDLVNVLSKKVIIQQIDNYLTYPKQK